MNKNIAIVDCRIDRECELSLVRCGFHVVKLPPCKSLSCAVSSHTDMLVCRLGNELVTTADYCDEVEWVFTQLRSLIPNIKISCTADTLSPEYPDDARLNVLRIGKMLFCRKDSASSYIKRCAEELGIEIVGVKQGYPACTVLKLNDSAAVTADCGMAKALRKKGIKVTLIDEGHIELPPHPYGFIGGAAGVFLDKLYFLGDPTLHPSYDAISAAACAEGLEIVPLSKGVLRDLGGILFIEGE